MPVKDARQELKDTTSQLLKTWLPRLTDPEYLANTSLGKALAGFAVAANPGVALAAPLLAKTLGNKQVGEVMDAYDMATKGMPMVGQADDALRLLAKTGPGLAVVPPMQRYYGRMKPRGVPASLSDIWHSALAEVMDKKFLEPGNPTDLIPLREIQEFTKNKLPGMGVPKNELAHFNLERYILNQLEKGVLPQYTDKKLASLPPDGGVVGAIEGAPNQLLEEYAANPNEVLRNLKVSRQNLADYIDKRIPALDLQAEGSSYNSYAMDKEMTKGVQHTTGEYDLLAQSTAGYQNYRIMNPSPSNAAPKNNGLFIGPDGRVGIDFAVDDTSIPSESVLRLDPDPNVKRHWGDNTGEIGHIRVTGAGSNYDPAHGLIVEEIQSDPGKSKNWPLGRYTDIAIPAIRKLAQEQGLDKFTVSPSGAHINRYKGWKVTKPVTKDEVLGKLGDRPLNYMYDVDEYKDNLPKEFVDKYVTPLKTANEKWQDTGNALDDYKEAAYKKAGVPQYVDEYPAPAGMSPEKIKELQDAYYSAKYAVESELYAKDKTFLKLVNDRQAALDEYKRIQTEGNIAFQDTYRHQVKDSTATKQHNFDGYVNVYDKFAPSKMRQMAKQTGEEVNVVNDINTRPHEITVENPFKRDTSSLRYSVQSLDELLETDNYKNLPPEIQAELKEYHTTKKEMGLRTDALNAERAKHLGPRPWRADFPDTDAWMAADNEYLRRRRALENAADPDVRNRILELTAALQTANDSFNLANRKVTNRLDSLQPAKKQQPGLSIKQLAKKYTLPSHVKGGTPVQPNFDQIFEYKINPDLRVTFPFWGK